MISIISNIVSRYIESASEKKREFVKTKYKLKPEDIPLLEAADPTSHGEYLDWLGKQYSKNNLRLPEDTQILRPVLELFHSIKNKAGFVENKDINSYRTVGDFYEAMEPYEGTSEVDTEEFKRSAVPGAEVYIKGSDFTWYKVTSPEAACSLGSGTKWCTVPNASVASGYLNRGPLYILYKAGKPVVQVHFESKQFKNTQDRPLGETYYYQFVAKNFSSEFGALFDKTGYRYEVVDKKDPNSLDLKIIAKNPEWAYWYARDILKGLFPAGEAVIAKDPYWSKKYAVDVLKGPFPAGEAAIAKDRRLAYDYARWVLKGPFLAGETVFAEDPYWAYSYAETVLKGRFPAGEAVIAKDPVYSNSYVQLLKSKGIEIPPLFKKYV